MTQQYGTVKVDFITFTSGTTGNETDITIPVSGLADIAESGINISGDISARNITATGNLSVSGQTLTSGLIVQNNATISGNLGLSGEVTASSVTVTGTLNASGDVNVSGLLTTSGLSVTGTADVNALNVTGLAAVGTLTTTGSATVNGPATLSSGLTVNGDTSTFNETVTIASGLTVTNGGIVVSNAGGLNVDGNAIFQDNLTVSGTANFDDINASGTTTFNELTVTGAMTFATGLFASGTEAAPSISFVGDTDTGFYNAAANEVRITTSGNDRLTVDDTGNVGIGTTAPDTTLDIVGGALNTANSINTNNQIRIGINDDDNYKATLSFGQPASPTANNYFLAISALTNGNPANIALAKDGGNVGIGTTSPSALLDINQVPNTFTLNTNTIDYTLFLQGGGPSATEGDYGASIGFSRNNGGQRTGAVIATKQTSSDADQQGIAFLTHESSNTNSNLAEQMIITHDGNVGIGTTSPNERFSVDVNGTTNRAIEIYNSDTVLSDGEVVHAIRFTQNDVSFPNTTHASIETVTTGSTGLLNMVFKARNNTEYMRINTNGNVGIGTISPNNLLSLAGSTPRIEITDTDTSGRFLIDCESTAGSVNLRVDQDNVVANSALQFSVDGTEQARIDDVGRLLVGTTTAIQTVNHLDSSFTPQLQSVNQGGTPAALLLAHFRSNNSVVPQLALQKARGTLAEPLTVNNNDTLGAIDFNAYDGTSYLGGAIIKGEVDGTPGTNDMPGRLVFSTTADGASSPTERMVIKSDGNVGIGTTDPISKLQVEVDSGTANISIVTGSTTDSSALEFGDPDDRNRGLIKYDHSDDSLSFRTSGSGEDMRIDNSGRLLVGTTSAPTIGGFTNAKLTVQDTAGSRINILRRNADATGAQLLFAKAAGNANQIVSNNDSIGRISYFAADGVDINSEAARIDCLIDGAPGANDMPGRLVFSTTADGASAPTERMRITNGGNVGIGMTNPQQLLGVGTDLNTDQGLFGISIGSSAATSARKAVIEKNTDSTNLSLTIRASTANTINAPIIFQNSTVIEAMRLAADGKVGINVTNIGQRLSINEGTNTDPADIAGLAKGTIFLSNLGGTEAQNNYGCSISFSRINTTRRGAMIASKQTTTNANQQGLAFFTRGSTNTSSDAISERMIIDHNGNVGIGLNPQTPLHVSGTARVSTLAGTGNRAVYSDANGNLTNSSSDATLKTNVATLGNQSEVVRQLRPVTYNWIDTEERGEQQEIGFIAQEVQPLVPQVIGVNHDETLSVDYPKLTAVLTKSLQEAIERIEQLESRLAALENS